MHTHTRTPNLGMTRLTTHWAPLLIVAGSVAVAVALLNLALVNLV